MTGQLTSAHVESANLEQLRRELEEARAVMYETPEDSSQVALRCQLIASRCGDGTLGGRALILQAAIALRRGDMPGALNSLVQAEQEIGAGDDLFAHAELCAVKSMLGFFSGSYAEALLQARASQELADESGDLATRIYARRAVSLVFGNVGVSDIHERVLEILALAIEAGDLWQQAITYNDLACCMESDGEIASAEQEIERGFEITTRIAGPHKFLLAVLHSTRSDIHFSAGRPEAALVDSDRSLQLLEEVEPDPYVAAASVRASVRAHVALGHHDRACEVGEEALGWLGERMPRTRSLILSAMSEALHAAGRLEEAYGSLSRAAELERQSFRELSELQLRLVRAETEARIARDQADRDYLTGLYNRRFLAREFTRMARDRRTGALSVAMIDLDFFKKVNDRFGHSVGDQVLIRAARLIHDVIRDTDIAIRAGGEEFMVLMPHTDSQAALKCCDRIRRRFSSEHWSTVAPGLTLTVSIGVASSDHASEPEALIRLADHRLYQAKRSGRAQTVGPSTEPQPADRIAAAD